MRPFVKQIHPDFHHNASAAVKRMNEQSLQKLNSILDTLEHLGRGPPNAQCQQEQQRGLQPPSLEASYELTFHLVPLAKGKGAEKSTSKANTGLPAGSAAAAAHLPPPIFTARLTFPSTTMSRFTREAPFATATTRSQAFPFSSPDEAAAAPPTPAIPEGIARQLRKLFKGARLPVPRELERPGGGSGQSRKRWGRSRREEMIGGAEVESMVLADLMARDLKVEGPSENQRRVAVNRLLRSGRVLTKGLSGAGEAVALRELEQVLVGVWDRCNLGEISGEIQIVLDAEAEMLHWDVLPDNRGQLIICPADVKGSRFNLALILRTIGGRRGKVGEESAGTSAGEGREGWRTRVRAPSGEKRVPDILAGGT